MTDSKAELTMLMQELASVCIRRGLKVATAESCTGGGVAYELTSIPGSSQWFERGFVTYSNQAKIDMLGVKPATLEAYGAVSEAVAKQMAEGAILHSLADMSLSITGIAGPEGGSREKPIGTCCFAWAGREIKTYSKRIILKGDRASIRFQAIIFSIKELAWLIKSG